MLFLIPWYSLVDYLIWLFGYNFLSTSPLSCATYPTTYSSLIWSCYNILRRVQNIRLLIMRVSRSGCLFIGLSLRYSLQHPVLKCPQYTSGTQNCACVRLEGIREWSYISIHFNLENRQWAVSLMSQYVYPWGKEALFPANGLVGPQSWAGNCTEKKSV